MRKKVLLMGGNSKAKSLAVSLLSQGYRVVIINDSYDDCIELSKIEGVTVICGDATKPFILEEAGADECDISIALMPQDADNLVASELCKKKFKVVKTVALVADPKKIEFFYKQGIDSVVCAIYAITSIIEQQAFIDQITTIIPIDKGKIEVIEVQIPKNSLIIGKKLWEINLPKEVIIGSILRKDTIIIPRGDSCILANDTLVVIANNAQQDEAIKILTEV